MTQEEWIAQNQEAISKLIANKAVILELDGKDIKLLGPEPINCNWVVLSANRIDRMFMRIDWQRE